MSEFGQLLENEAELVSRFVEVLKKEQIALKAGDTPALPDLESEKTGLVEQLNAIDNHRNSFLLAFGFSSDRDGTQGWLSANPTNLRAAKAWERLLKLTAEAREINILNGQLIAMRLNITNQALEILTQQARKSVLYGKDGQTSQLTGSRIIDTA